jgi:hypothetical protein
MAPIRVRATSADVSIANTFRGKKDGCINVVLNL